MIIDPQILEVLEKVPLPKAELKKNVQGLYSCTM